MLDLQTTLFSNACFVIPLAIIAIIASRLIHDPTIRWMMWAIVLFKFVTPSLVTTPIEFESLFRFDDSPKVSAPLADSATNSTQAAGEHSKFVATGATAQREMKDRRPNSQISSDFDWLRRMLIAVWCVGSCMLLFVAVKRIIRFHRLVKRTDSPEAETTSMLLALANELGLKRIPDVRIATGRLPPLLWVGARRATILLPQPLFSSMDSEQQRTLIAHELSHFVRRDHWFRWLELAVRCIFWWHPIAWLACNRLRNAEEECCDAKVVQWLPESASAYARTIVTTLDYFASDTLAVPSLATGIKPLRRSVRPLHRRIAMICDQTPRRRTNLFVRLSVPTIAALVLPLSLFADGSDSERFTDLVSPLVQLDEREAAQSPPKMATPQEYQQIAVVAREFEVLMPIGKEYRSFLRHANASFPVIATTLTYIEEEPRQTSFLAIDPKDPKGVLRVIAPEKAQRAIGKFISGMSQVQSDALEMDDVTLARGSYRIEANGVDSFVELLETYHEYELITPLLVKQDGADFTITTYMSVQEHIADFIESMNALR